MNIEEQIKSEILSKNKDIRLDSFINKALFDGGGYYYNKKPIGIKNDFITAPEISQMFGEIIGLYLFYVWKTKIKSRFNLIELGPGKGSLFKDIANSVSKYPIFLDQAKILFVEINEKLIEIQKSNIKELKYQNVNWSSSVDFNSNLPSIIYSNEFFDCFPVRQFILKEIWFERYVSYNKNDNNFYFKNIKINNKKLIDFLNLYKKNKLLEVSFQRNEYFEKICKLIKNKGGIFFTIDYGYLKNINNFSLQAIQNHKFSNVLENVGEKDISSHVNFRDLLDIAMNNGLNIEECCTQREFLINYGILERKKNLSKLKNSKNLEKELERLTGKKEMGDLFKCLIVSNL